MNCLRRSEIGLVFRSLLVCALALQAGQAQQPSASSHFGGGAMRPETTMGSGGTGASSSLGNHSSWGSGQGSFGSSAQPGGIWTDGASLNAGPGASSRSHATAAAPSYPIAPVSFSARPSTSRGMTGLSGAQALRSSTGIHPVNQASSRGPAFKPAGTRFVTSSSGSRSGKRNFGSSKRASESSSNLASRARPETHLWESASDKASSALAKPETGVKKTYLGDQQ